MGLERKQQLFFDAVEHSVRFVRLTYKRIEYGLVSDVSRDSVDLPAMDAMVLDCWIIVDVAKRLRTLIQHTPGLKRSPSVELFLSRTSGVPRFRDYIQHIEEKAEVVSETGLPIWGTMSWVSLLSDKKFAIKVYAPGRLAVCKGIPVVNPAGREFHGNVDHIELSVDSRTVNISELARQVDAFGVRVERAVRVAEESRSRDESGIIRFTIEEGG